MLRFLVVLFVTTNLLICTNGYEAHQQQKFPEFNNPHVYKRAPNADDHYGHHDHGLSVLESKMGTLIHKVAFLNEQIEKVLKGQEIITGSIVNQQTIMDTGFAASQKRFSDLEKQLSDLTVEVKKMVPQPCPQPNDYSAEFNAASIQLQDIQQSMTTVSTSVNTLNNRYDVELNSRSECVSQSTDTLMTKMNVLEEQHVSILSIANEIKNIKADVPEVVNDCVPSKEVSPAGEFIISMIHDHKVEWCKNEKIAKFCDEKGNLIIQLHENNNENFNRTWSDYKWGFGDIKKGNFWLGNEALYQLTSKTGVSLRLDFEDFNKESRWAEYDQFKVSNEHHGYALLVSGFSGTAGDSMIKTHNGNTFTTYDYLDHNLCPVTYGAGWWFEGTVHTCHTSLPNGLIDESGKRNDNHGIIWNAWKESKSLAKSKMSLKLKPKTSIHGRY